MSKGRFFAPGRTAIGCLRGFGARGNMRMVSACCVFLAQVLVVSPVRADSTADELTTRFQAHINYLADDKLEGRGVGTKGIDDAADYIVKQFTEIGLKPGGEKGSFFQSFPMTLHRELTDRSRFEFVGDDTKRKRDVDFIPLSFSSDDAFEGDLVFCGYGIINPDRKFDDFEGINLEGKVALMLMGEPASWADENGFSTKHAMFRNKVYNAKDRGAVAVLLVNQTPGADGDKLTPFITEHPDEYGLPVFHVSRAIVEEKLTRMKMDSLAKLQEKLDAGGFATSVVPHIRVSGQAGFEKKTAPAKNVIALLKGEGALADEYIVIGAHYDHLGKCRPMSRTFKAGKLVHESEEPQIHNGADDNASGVSGIIEIARMLAKDSVKSRRSFVFIAFSAEESGLHGSKYYVDHPTFPLEKTVAMLNLDMVGRVEPGKNKVEIFGLATSPDFESIVNRQAGSVGMGISPGVDEGGRSDHASFMRSNIPSMHFFSGQHADYHKPSDDSEKINAPDGVRICRLITEVARELATRDAKPAFQVVENKKKDDPGPLPTYRVVMGIAPSYTDDGLPGMGVDGVNPEGPAEIAGMKAKDRIIRIGGKKIANIYDYMASTRNNKPGDEVEVVVVRDGKELTLKVTLSGSK